MAMGSQLGVQQLVVHGELETSAIRWHQGDRLDIRLKFFEQLGYQTGSTIGVVSDRTVDQVYFHQHNDTSEMYLKNNPAGDATG